MLASILNHRGITEMYYAAWRGDPDGRPSPQGIPPRPQYTPPPRYTPSFPEDPPRVSEMRQIALIEAIIGLALAPSVLFIGPIFGPLLIRNGEEPAEVLAALSIISAFTALFALGISIAAVWNASHLGPGRFRTATLIIGIIGITIASILVVGWLLYFLGRL